MPADGDREGFNLLGVPMMMEYDTPTRSWKLVVDTELDTVIVVSGTVSLEAGDLEIGAVEIKDATSDQRAIVNALGQLHVFITGSFIGADTELPAAVLLSDALPNPTAPAVGSYLLLWDEDDTWVRARAGWPAQDGVNPNEVDPAVAVASYLQAYDGTGSYNRLFHDASRNLMVTLVSGSFPTGETLPVSLASLPDLVATEDEVTAYVTGSVSLVVNPTMERDIINITGTAGEYMLVTGVAGQQLRVMEIKVSTSNLMNVRLQSGWTGTAITGPIHLANSGEEFYAGAPDGVEMYHFETLSGQMLILDADAGGQLGGWIIYYYE